MLVYYEQTYSTRVTSARLLGNLLNLAGFFNFDFVKFHQFQDVR